MLWRILRRVRPIKTISEKVKVVRCYIQTRGCKDKCLTMSLCIQTRGVHKGGRREAPPPLVEESQPSGLSGPYAHAPCWLKMSLSLKLRCRAPQLPPAVFSGPKIGQGRKLVKKVKIWKVLKMGLPIVENLSGLQENIFSLSRRPQLHFGQKFKN